MKRETLIDATLKALHKMFMTGWPPNKTAVPADLLPYWSFSDEISTYEGFLVKAHQVIIPALR